MYIYIYFRMTVSEKESTSLSVSIFEYLDTIITKEVSCTTDSPDDFATDTEQKCSSSNSAVVTTLTEHVDMLKDGLEISSL